MSSVQSNSSSMHHSYVSSQDQPRQRRPRESLLRDVASNKCELEEKGGVSPGRQQMKGTRAALLFDTCIQSSRRRHHMGER
ncbi:hypothetical protein BT69DRAFT_116731 [Atractiella rhizophila]|nr:hypothetical protein BT69DRAFT_116731 [Atractiella rhizophila]